MPPEPSRLFIALYTDEDVTADLAPALRRRGYVAQSAAEVGNLGIPDEAQLAYAAERGMAILTYNLRISSRWPERGTLPVGNTRVSSSRNSSVSDSSRSCCGECFAC